ncbi:MAG: Gfo/Idh/MocA family oxidoreductase, partial [Pseudomonadota bacterium]
MVEQINTTSHSPKIAVIGAGYWGKNHVRNFHELGALAAVCDADVTLRDRLAASYPNVRFAQSPQEIFEDPEIQGVVVATPAVTHFDLTLQALRAGKDVLVEKPLALHERDGEKLVEMAEKSGAVLMVGHILLYHPAVTKLKELVQRGDLGRIQHIQSNRLSLGKIRSEENILWSFAPHDISMLLYLLDEMPDRIHATGFSHLQRNVEDVTISVMEFPSGVSGHIYVSWMNPIKEQRLTVMGDKAMAVFEDSRPDKKLRIFHNSFHWVDRHPVPSKGDEEEVPFEPLEPLKAECAHFLECITTRQRPRSDGGEGLRTLSVLQRCYESMKAEAACRTAVAPMPPSREPAKEFFCHESAVIDEPCEIGQGVSIWHHTHVMKDAVIGGNCRIGQNVLIGKGVRIGHNCKIQNNVAVYEGVTLEDSVFCGPSMVFTNVYNPRCEIPRMGELRSTLVKQGATLGANSTILCGITIGRYAFVGAGAVVLRDVPDYALMVGNPAKQIGWMSEYGERLHFTGNGDGTATCPHTGQVYRWKDGMV